MIKTIICLALTLVLFACGDTPGDKNKVNGVDTTVIGSDNPNPLPDTTGMNGRPDTLKNK